MKCCEFKNWLNDKDLFDEDAEASAIKHIELCEPCKRLYVLDLHIEAQIQEGLKQVDPPKRLLASVEMNLESPVEDKSINLLSWKKLIPIFAIAAIFLLIFNPFTTKIGSLEEVGALVVNNHKDKISRAIKVGEVEGVISWFGEKIGRKVLIPDLTRQNIQHVGGRKCHLARNDVAYVLCEEKGKLVSLFIIDPDDVNYDIKDKEIYYTSKRECKVKIWKEADLLYAVVE